MKASVVTILVATLLVETHQQGTFYPGCWTEWFDRDDPTGTGDWETLSDQRQLTPDKICDKPLKIEVQTVAGSAVFSTEDIITVSDTITGFVCENKKQTKTKMCSDYKVRYLCPVEFCHPKGCWTEWFNRDNPTSTGDWETLERLSSENPGQICDNPLYIEVQTTAGASVESTGDIIVIASPSSGFVCENDRQRDKSCEDYKVRFYCPEEFCLMKGCWTDWFDRDNPSATGDWEMLEILQHEYPGKICDFPLKIDVQTTSGNSVASTGDVISVSDIYTGFVCKNSDQLIPPCEDYKVRFFCPEKFCVSKGCWTDWFDRDNPGGNGDSEDLETLLKENPGKICEFPLKIEVQTTSGNSVSSTGDIINVSDTVTGFVCKNSEQPDGRCEDYRVRFFCPEAFCNSTIVTPPNSGNSGSPCCCNGGSSTGGNGGQCCKYYKVCYGSPCDWPGVATEILNNPPFP